MCKSKGGGFHSTKAKKDTATWLWGGSVPVGAGPTPASQSSPAKLTQSLLFLPGLRGSSPPPYGQDAPGNFLPGHGLYGSLLSSDPSQHQP